jgi:hypothetical protein
MSRVYISKKSPLVAGVLSVVPGLGQIYNEQTGKGLLLFILFVGTFLFFVLRLSPFAFIPIPGDSSVGSFMGFDYVMSHAFRLNPFFHDGISKVSPLLWLIAILPVMVLFSIADAIQNARRINLGFVHTPSPAPPPPSPSPGAAVNASNEQEHLRKEAQQKMSETETVSESASGTFQSSPEETMNTQQTSQTENAAAETPKKRRSRGVSGKLFIGVLFMGIGGMFILGEHLSIKWGNLWPLIPLIFGLRLLRDYQRDRDRGQLVLGSIFTVVGGAFMLDLWTGFNLNWFIYDIIGYLILDNWMFIMFGIGCFFVLLDVINRKKNK